MIKKITLLFIASSIFIYSTICQADTDTTRDVSTFTYSLPSPLVLKLLDKTVHDNVFAGNSCSTPTCDNGSSCSITCSREGEYAYCRCGSGGAYCTCICNKIGGCN